MNNRTGPKDVRSVIDRVEHAGEDGRVAIADVMDEIGTGAFGPLLLVPALILVSPLSGIPGMPSIGSLLISLIAIQIVLRRKSLWLPAFLRNRTVSKERLDNAMAYLHKPARLIDRVTHRRLVFLVGWPFRIVPALISSVMVLFAPAFEMVPFSVSVAAAAVSLFGLAMVTEDGLLVLIGLAFIGAAIYLCWMALS
ncbi:exopolysaccharide biosynthesis protein [Chelativorans sp. YIM 93263]|uniref:exopolysaccharide biosynthesis protein n=1 Tax=Chelativorans sp. YIM 93263 TaxID=2906648 RepID=UPI0023786235|nr:exopolysaccharide biosynthesis protein [Chelativorans sp. YIM 93263]